MGNPGNDACSHVCLLLNLIRKDMGNIAISVALIVHLYYKILLDFFSICLFLSSRSSFFNCTAGYISVISH